MKSTEPNLVWSSMLDDKYLCKVVRKRPYMGELEIWEGEKKIYSEEVGLSYDALFGPDTGDVGEWADKCIAVVDKTLG